ncbi:MAG TPA: ATP-binding cassette domain-containing protein [Geminicoccaceae bacterium]|nr:ATP-binding cassette domain-containing protein [Geminicoccaceae bacterium]
MATALRATRPASGRAGPPDEPAIRLRGIVNQLDGRRVHDGLDLDVPRGEVMGLIGGSGAGKSVLLRSIVGLLRPQSGTVELLGQRPAELGDAAARRLRERYGMLFQDGALFSSLTVTQNIQVPVRERYRLPARLLDEVAALKLALVGLPADAGPKFPAELSGGMRKRAGLARALALDPELLFLDEPTAGLDPIAAAAFDELMRSLSDTLGLTVLMVTHDLDSLLRIADRVAALIDGRAVIGTLDELRRNPDPWLQAYFNGVRGRAALAGPRSPAARGA